jgi:MoaA/NifB/PqqE/SkfB family radical SAM enzyme
VKYQLQTAVWELTMACNMRCMHCGSSCEKRLPGELSTEEALDLCCQLADLGLRFITLSGGEPLLRKDWPEIASALTRRSVVVNMISNGWLLDDAVIDKAQECNLYNLAVSLDGIGETHDLIRQAGAYEHVIAALQRMQRRRFPSVKRCSKLLGLSTGSCSLDFRWGILQRTK